MGCSEQNVLSNKIPLTVNRSAGIAYPDVVWVRVLRQLTTQLSRRRDHVHQCSFRLRPRPGFQPARQLKTRHLSPVTCHLSPVGGFTRLAATVT